MINNESNVLKRTKEIFLDFLVDAINEFAPEKTPKISFYDANKFTNDWVEKNFCIKGDDNAKT